MRWGQHFPGLLRSSKGAPQLHRLPLIVLLAQAGDPGLRIPVIPMALTTADRVKTRSLQPTCPPP